MSPKHQARLSAIEEFLRRYRLLTMGLLQSLAPFREMTREALEKFLQRQVHEGNLRRHRLGRGETYYTFGRAAARRLGLPRSATKAFSEQSLPAAAAVVCYCIRNSLVRLTGPELQAQFPELYSPRLGASPVYIEHRSQPHRFAILLVDRANSLKCLFQKIAHRLGQRQQIGAYSQWMLAGRVQLTVLTLTNEKKRQIELAASKLLPRTIRIRVDVEPTLKLFYRGR